MGGRELARGVGEAGREGIEGRVGGGSRGMGRGGGEEGRRGGGGSGGEKVEGRLIKGNGVVGVRREQLDASWSSMKTPPRLGWAGWGRDWS